MTSEPHLPPRATPPPAFVAAPRPTASLSTQLGLGPLPVVGLVVALAGAVIGLGLLVFVLVVVQLIDGWQDGVSQALSTR